MKGNRQTNMMAGQFGGPKSPICGGTSEGGGHNLTNFSSAATLDRRGGFPSGNNCRMQQQHQIVFK